MIITAKSDYITKANAVFYNLQEYEDIFYMEAQIVDYMKCHLLRNDVINDFYIDNCLVNVYTNGNEYNLYFDEYRMNIETYEKQIINVNIQKLWNIT